jgi:hypothetical protein
MIYSLFMNTPTSEEISERARAIWKDEGCPEGRDVEHWLRAERELQKRAEPAETPSETAGTIEAREATPPVALNGGAKNGRGPSKNRRAGLPVSAEA